MMGLILIPNIQEQSKEIDKEVDEEKTSEVKQPTKEPIAEPIIQQYPKIASWLAKKKEVIESGKPYSLVMTSWFTPEEAKKIKLQNPNALLLAGLTINWVYDSADWMTFLEIVGNYGKKEKIKIKESMYLRKPNGERCAFGWASKEWGHKEIYAMDPRNPEWVKLITSFYKNVLEQPQHDGIIIDMVTERSWCPNVISDEEWVEATKAIMLKIKKFNTENKLIIFNSGRNFSEIDEYVGFFDGYLMENFLGNEFGASFDEGLKAAESRYIVIYAVDTDNTGKKDLKRMRLGLTLSLLNDNTYFTYDFGSRNHGQAWWFPEYDVNLGKPIGRYYKKDNAYWREFEKGVVVSSPYSDVTVNFDEEYTDVTSGITSKEFLIERGDGRIFIKHDAKKIVKREDKIPKDAIKITPETDTNPPRLHSNEWEEPVPLPSTINTAGVEDSPFITPDGNTLYFWFTPAANIPPHEQIGDGVTGIYYSTKTANGWSEARRLKLGEDSEDHLDGCPFVQGNKIWFCSIRKGNYGTIDYWIANLVNGIAMNVTNAGKRLNLEIDVGELHITTNGNELYFSANFSHGKGGYDIWVTRKVNGVWQEPKNVEAVNSKDDEGQPFITQDGKELWFTRLYNGSPAIFRSIKVKGKWSTPELIISNFAGEPSLDNKGNIYFVHHFYKDNKMIEADIYVAKRKIDYERGKSVKKFSIVPLGMTIFPKGEPSEWTDRGFTKAFEKAKEAGISISIWRHQWGDIETLLGNYKWDDIDYEISKTKEQGLKYSLIIEIIHTNRLGKYPKGISFTKFDEPDFVNNFKSFIKALLTRYSGKIDYLWIGNEVDMYLHNNKEQIEPFLNFYQEIKDEIKSANPSIIVGIVGAYHLARNNNEIKLLQELAKKGDAIALTIYMEDDESNPSVSDTQSYFEQMLNLFPNKKIVVIETAWSSRGPKGSEDRQAEYVKEIAKVIEKHKDRFLFFAWFNLYDIPEKMNRRIAMSFGVSVNTKMGKQFLNWQGSLGLLNADGTEKLAWKAWKEYLLLNVENE
jgi:hypothetical protein